MLDFDTVMAGLLGMSYVCRGQRPEDVNAGMVDAWLARLNENKVSPPEFLERVRAVSDTAGFFPSLGEFLKPLLANKPSFAVIEDPVQVAPDMIASRKTAEVEGLPILESEVLPALPTPEQRADSFARLESKVVEKAKQRRVKVSDLIAQDKSLPAPLSTREIEAKRELMRRQVGK